MLSEGYEVELLQKYPKYHRALYELMQICNALTPEFEMILTAVDFVLDNMYIDTASEYGISRLESIANITPNEEDDLEARRFRLLTKFNENVPYTDNTLDSMLYSLCGEGNYAIEENYTEYALNIITNLVTMGAFDEVYQTLKKMIPANLVLTLENKINETLSQTVYCGGGISMGYHYELYDNSEVYVTNSYASIVNAYEYKSYTTEVED